MLRELNSLARKFSKPSTRSASSCTHKDSRNLKRRAAPPSHRKMMAAQTEDAVTRWRARPPGSLPELVLVEPAVRAETTFRLDLVAPYAEEGYRAASAVLAARRVP